MGLVALWAADEAPRRVTEWSDADIKDAIADQPMPTVQQSQDVTGEIPDSANSGEQE